MKGPDKYRICILFFIFSVEKYEEYIEAIHNAERNYIECNATRCECFKDIVIRDLKPFKKNGISKELIDIAKTRYVCSIEIDRHITISLFINI